MRITQNMMTRNYLKTANKNQSNLAKSIDRMGSGQKNNRISEGVSDEIRALRVREQLSDTNQYLTNIRDAEADMSAAESNLKSINEILQTAQEKTLAAKSDTYQETGRKEIGQQLGSLRDQIVQFANAQFSDKYIFSGTNNSRAPFAFDDDKGLSYNGIPVNNIYKKDGTYFVGDATNPLPTDEVVPQDEDVYIDMGLGIKMNQKNVDPSTAFKLSFSGLDILGFGTDTEDGVSVSNNLVNTLDALSKEFEKPVGEYNAETVGANFNVLVRQTDKLVLNMTEIGTRCNFMEKTGDGLENDILNLSELQNKLEGVEDTKETMYLKQYEYQWMLTLQFGSNVFPKSLMDFIA